MRPEFSAYLDDEEKTINLVKDVADVLDKIAVNHLHTPALYSSFLKALISARLDSGNDAKGDIPPQGSPPRNESTGSSTFDDPLSYLNEFQFDSEMGPVVDMSTFPPTMAPVPSEDFMGGMKMDNILSNAFWDSMLVPGYNTLDGLSGGFVFGAGGSGLITPGIGLTPTHSRSGSPLRGLDGELQRMSSAFDDTQDGLLGTR